MVTCTTPWLTILFCTLSQSTQICVSINSPTGQWQRICWWQILQHWTYHQIRSKATRSCFNTNKLTSKQANNHRSLSGVFVLPVGCPPLLYLVQPCPVCQLSTFSFTSYFCTFLTTIDHKVFNLFFQDHSAYMLLFLFYLLRALLTF